MLKGIESGHQCAVIIQDNPLERVAQLRAMGRETITSLKAARKAGTFLYLDGKGEQAMQLVLPGYRRAVKRFTRPLRSRASSGWRRHIRRIKAAE